MIWLLPTMKELLPDICVGTLILIYPFLLIIWKPNNKRKVLKQLETQNNHDQP